MKRAFLLGFLAVSLASLLVGIAGAIVFHTLPYRIPWRSYETIFRLVAIAGPICVLLLVMAIILAGLGLSDSSSGRKLKAMSLLNLLAALALLSLATIARPISTVRPLNQCINNQRLINNWILSNRPELNQKIWPLVTAPCPSGGNYAVSAAGVQCSIPDHNFHDDSLTLYSNSFLQWIRQFDPNGDDALSQSELRRASTNWLVAPK